MRWLAKGGGGGGELGPAASGAHPQPESPEPLYGFAPFTHFSNQATISDSVCSTDSRAA